MSEPLKSPAGNDRSYRGGLIQTEGEQRVLVLDFGSQTAQLIARRVREQDVFCQIVRPDLSADRIRELAPKGLILSGGPASVYAEGAPQPDPAIFDLDVPILGICYGMQIVCRAMGSEIKPGKSREFGRTEATVTDSSDLFFGITDSFTAWMSHGDQVEGLSENFDPLAVTDTCPAAAVRHKERPIFGLQFHPEVTHTQFGGQLLKNFVRDICGAKGSWKISSLIEQEVEAIRQRVGSSRVICGLSGGVDSSVVAALLAKAIGTQVSCIFVDNGLLRKNERDKVSKRFGDHFKTDLHVVDARDRFMSALAGVSDPQKKRKIIGREFIEVFKHEAKSIDDARFLAQGTLYPDVIESGANPDGPAATIKSHHNVGGLPEELGFELIEPLRELFKDEVRQMGAELGLPDELIWRHPFPGPGLAVRCLGEVTEERLEVLREADALLIDELYRNNLYREIQQAFAVLLPVQSVGVMGDGRTYENAVAIRAVQSSDFMTADWYPMPHDVLGRIATRIINSVRGVNRVVYDVSSKPPATIEWE
ncbi:glutamine-hydrolyzing GMP synthase [Stratiformator vulcanicus]|uniref:GMP synthase [glutamine-hydrolyzing] n=1 Tax=Stratiformator vulcanicus TaxID=2527980 RepID=A0A517R1K9_9PLAN|nr:glutamine-hydrolyzing GMP synthase [Stratiformator vulcanicus]QDT37779.1 GMP synthase [glutamine-hydrolyzing] [Stratiformator vulcanicus]